MKKQSLSLILTSALFLSIFSMPKDISATENTVEKQNTEIISTTNDVDSNEEKKSVSFNPVTINFILEGIDAPLKTPKILDSSNDFWSDYTVKLSNQLMYGGIDIQQNIRDYYFSHYEIDGLRIESIDAIIELKNEHNVINVVYSEEIPKGGYLRKNFRDGIGLDINYLKSTFENNSNAITDLYDNRWILEFTPKLSNEIYKNVSSFVNANDKTIYLKCSTSSLSDKEQNELTKKYGYIESITLNSSLEYNDFKNNYILTYTLPNNVTEFNNIESVLYGINLEGKIEILSKSVFDNNSTQFELNVNTNKYQLLFVGVQENSFKTETENNLNEIETEKDKEDTNIKNDTIIPNTIDTVVDNKNHTLNEQSFVMLVLICFASGSIFTFILALILSARNENIKKKAINKKTNDEE